MSNGPQEDAASQPMTLERLTKLNDLKIEVQTDLSPTLDAVNEMLSLNMQPCPESYHITVLSPAERKQYDAFDLLDAEKIAELEAINNEIQQGTGLTVTGIGFIDGSSVPNIREADKGKKTCFITVDAPKLNAFRNSIGLPPKDFHITLGFVDKDIHMDVDKNPIPKKPDSRFQAIAETIPALVLGNIDGNEKKKKMAKNPPSAPKPKTAVTYEIETVRQALKAVAVERGSTDDPNAIFLDEVDDIATIASERPDELGRTLRQRMKTLREALNKQN